MKQGVERASRTNPTIFCSPTPTSSTCPTRSRPRFGSAGEWARAQFADGQAALRELRRARLRSGVHLLFPDALPVRLGERPQPQAGGGGGRLHAGAPRRARGGRRHRGHPRRLDRRLRARARAQAARSDPAQPDGPRASIRAYPAMQDIRRMVARSAYAQLGYSPVLLAGTIAGMALVYLVPPCWRCSATAWRRRSASSPGRPWRSRSSRCCGSMGCRRFWGPLPRSALAYMAFTVDSAYQYARKRGGVERPRSVERERRA